MEIKQYDTPDIRNLIDNDSEYFQTTVIDNKFTMRSTLAEDWLNRKKCVIVIDSATGNKMFLTPFDFTIDAISDNIFKRNYQEGRFATLTFNWEPDNPYLPDTEISKWSEALLKRFNFTWFNLLRNYLITEKFRTLNRYANKDERDKKTIFPSMENTYRSFSSNASSTRVIVIGQDPYPSSHANGIGYATDQISKPVSLRQIEKTIQKQLNYPLEWQIQNNLENVIKQGVLFLNTALTVEANKPGTYTETWKPFIEEVIKVINEFPNPLIFLLTGKNAQSFSHLIDNSKHYILSVEHPSYAARQERDWETDNAFFKINEKLKELGTPEIKW